MADNGVAALLSAYYEVQAKDIADRIQAANKKYSIICDLRLAGLSAKEIGGLLGISRQRVYQILNSHKVDDIEG